MLCPMQKKKQKYTTLNQTGPVYYLKAWTEPRNAGPETELGLYFIWHLDSDPHRTKKRWNPTWLEDTDLIGNDFTANYF